MTEKQSVAIKNIRIISTFMIFLCHTVYLFGNIIGMTAQFFNIAVTVFFFVSACLYSMREKILGGVLTWYKKRFFRISIPYYLFLLFLLLIYLAFGNYVKPIQWITSVLIVSGITETSMPETSHLWFVSAILLCYLITPVLYKIRCNKKVLMIFTIVICSVYIPVVFFMPDIISTYYFSILEYILAFFLLNNIIKKLSNSLGLFIGIVSLIFGCGVKLFGNVLFDGSVLYEKFIVEFCSLIIGFGIFATIYFFSLIAFMKVERNLKIISFLDSISYEFYIVHFMFTKEKFVNLFPIVPLLQLLLAFLFSIVFGYVLHILSERILKVIR